MAARSLHQRVGVLHQARVGGDEVAVAVGLGDTGPEPLPFLGEEARDAPVEPVDLRASRGGDAGEHDLRHSVRVPLGVGESQRRPPGPPGQQPAVDTEVLAQQLHIREQMLGGVGAHVRGRVTRVRGAAPAPTLIEQHGPVAVRIDSAHPRRAPRSRPAVDHQCRLALRVAANLPVHQVPIADVEHPLVIGLEGRVELDHVLVLSAHFHSPASRAVLLLPARRGAPHITAGSGPPLNDFTGAIPFTGLLRGARCETRHQQIL